MAISRKDVKHVAHLARLEMPEERLDYYAPQLESIIAWVDQLAEVDTDGVDPLANVSDIDAPLRKDEVTDGNIQKEILKNAPEETSGFFVVPKVVE